MQPPTEISAAPSSENYTTKPPNRPYFWLIGGCPQLSVPEPPQQYCPVRSVSESGSAFSAASLQDFSSVGSFHSLSEAVLLASLALLGLIGSEHAGTSFYIV